MRIVLTNLGRRGILVLTFSLCILVLLSEFFSSQVSFVCWANEYQIDSVGREIDVYTNKEPYSGKGANQESDAFEPQEEIVLYGLVTYNRDPVAGKIVAFDVHGPVNSVENLTLTISDTTNESGIAHVSFIMPWPDARPKVAIFGVWNVMAAVDIAGVIVTDTLSFKVGWIVELLYIKTVDLSNILKSTFSKGERMGFRLEVRNIAMTQKTATFVVSASDELNVGIGVIKLEDEVVPPGEKEYFVKEMIIPKSAFVGQGRATANALKTVQGGALIPWCPEVETRFGIGILHDVAVVNVVPSAREAYPCQAVNITVLVKNKGQVDESFYVSAYYNSTLIGKLWVESLASNAERTLIITWYIDYIQTGEYVIKAEAGPVPGETLLEDNVFIDDIVKIKSPPYPPPSPPPYPVVWDVRWVLAALFILIVLVGVLLVLAVMILLTCRRRRKRDEEEPRKVVERLRVLPSSSTKKCKVCGKEFPAVYTFCPHCTSFHGRDFE